MEMVSLLSEQSDCGLQLVCERKFPSRLEIMASMDLKSFLLALSEPRTGRDRGHWVRAAGRWDRDTKSKANTG